MSMVTVQRIQWTIQWKISCLPFLPYIFSVYVCVCVCVCIYIYVYKIYSCICVFTFIFCYKSWIDLPAAMQLKSFHCLSFTHRIKFLLLSLQCKDFIPYSALQSHFPLVPSSLLQFMLLQCQTTYTKNTYTHTHTD